LADFWPAINNIGLIIRTGRCGSSAQAVAALAIDKQAAEPQMAMAVALYTKGDRKQSLAMEAALRIDNRHADLEYLKQQLWAIACSAIRKVSRNTAHSSRAARSAHTNPPQSK